VAIWNGLDTSSEPPRQPLGSAIRRALEILILHLGMVTLPFTRLCTQVPSTKKNKPALRTSLSLLFFLAVFLAFHVFPLTSVSLENSFP
jgi:nitrate reductase NapE component